MMVVFISLFSSAYEKLIFSESQENKLFAKAEVEKVANALNQVSLAGNGANFSVDLSGELKSGKNYSISIFKDNRIIDIVWDGQHESTPILIGNISGITSNINASINISNVFGELIIKYA